LSFGLRTKGYIKLNAASSGITSLLLSGGLTTDSSFRIPLQINETSICTF
jgi:hypothetical protein